MGAITGGPEEGAKGSRRNKFTNLSVETTDRQDAQAQESAAADFQIPQRSQAGCSGA
jgi:hypothetical protein